MLKHITSIIYKLHTKEKTNKQTNISMVTSIISSITVDSSALLNKSNHWSSFTYPLSFLAAILNMMAGLEVVSMWAEASWL